MNITRRPATEADIPFLLALRRDTMDVHLRADGASTSDEAHLARLMHRFDCAEVLLRGDEPVGLLKLQQQPGAWHIVQLQLIPRWHGKGIGRSLLEGVIGDASRAHADLTLSVLKANPARRLYERLGFVVTGEDAREYFMRRSL